MSAMQMRQFSKIKEVVAGWSQIREYLRGGDEGTLVPVVIPKDRRRFGWIFLLGLALYFLGAGIFSGSGAILVLSVLVALFLVVVSGLWLWRGAIVEIEQGTTGVLTKYGKITGTLPPGRHYLWFPWTKVDFVVDTSTEIPYLAPVVSCPTQENVPLKAIEFFLKFKIEDPVAFVRVLGASNFDLVLSSAVQDAIRQRSRLVHTEQAYDLRGSDVEDTRDTLNRQLERYGVRILGANIPDVQLPDQYQDHLATRERVSKELAAYEREWELVRKQRIDTLLMEIERSKKEREARLVEVSAARNKARQDVARMLEERETEAQKVRMEIETKGRTALIEAENEAKALTHLGQAYRDNRAVLQYELARKRVAVGEKLMQNAPRPVIVQGESGEQSALSTLLLARLLPQMDVGDSGGNGRAVKQAIERGAAALDAESLEGEALGDIQDRITGQGRRG